MVTSQTVPWQLLIATFVLGLLASPASADPAGAEPAYETSTYEETYRAFRWAARPHTSWSLPTGEWQARADDVNAQRNLSRMSKEGFVVFTLESAIATYQSGALEEAYREFEELAKSGDEEARGYLDQMREERVIQFEQRPQPPVLGDPQPHTEQSPSQAAHEQSAEPDERSSDWRFGDLLKQRVEPAETEIAIPYHPSVWSRIFHLPADATMIGLQYVDLWLDADKQYADVRYVIGHGNAIILGIMATIWWFMILRVLYSIGAILSALIRAAITPLEDKAYG